MNSPLFFLGMVNDLASEYAKIASREDTQYAEGSKKVRNYRQSQSV